VKYSIKKAFPDHWVYLLQASTSNIIIHGGRINGLVNIYTFIPQIYEDVNTFFQIQGHFGIYDRINFLDGVCIFKVLQIMKTISKKVCFYGENLYESSFRIFMQCMLLCTIVSHIHSSPCFREWFNYSYGNILLNLPHVIEPGLYFIYQLQFAIYFEVLWSMDQQENRSDYWQKLSYYLVSLIL